MDSGAPPLPIFIVDDDEGLLRLMERALKREGFATATANSAAAAGDWLSGNEAALMLLDLKLPDLSGMELVNRLTRVEKPVPFIIITGQGDERVAVEMMKSGAMDYVVKDAQLLDFLPSVVRRALDQIEKDRRLAAAQAALEESRQQLVSVSEREQRRFGAELHDGLGQQLTAVSMLCATLENSLPADRPDLEEQLTQIKRYLREAVSQTRALAHNLAPLSLGAGGLHDALSELAERMSRSGQVECRFDPEAAAHVEDETVAGHLFRIAQEAVNNAVRHSGATEVVIRLTRENAGGGPLKLEIADNGQGLRSVAGSGSGKGIGLEVMRHRASVISGELRLDSPPGKGLTVTCVVGLNVEGDANAGAIRD